VTIFTLFLPVFVLAALVMGGIALFCVFWCVLALPFRFAFGRNWAVATIAGASACFMAGALAMILMPEKAVMLYRAVRSVLDAA
jgi:hypothetical protein